MSTLMEMRPAETPDVIDDARHASQPGINVIIDIRRVINLLLCIVTTLVITGTIANVIIYQVAPSPEHKLARLMHRFDLGFEPSLPNWYSSFALLASSGLLAIIGLAKWRAADRFFKHWLALAVIFLGLSIDEGVRMHEMIHTAVVHFVDVHGILYLQTIVPTLLIVVIIGLCSQATGVFGGLVLLDPRENSFAVPVNRAASVLAGLCATLIAAGFIGGQPLSSGELVGAVLVVAAIAALTLGPRFDRAPAKSAS